MAFTIGHRCYAHSYWQWDSGKVAESFSILTSLLQADAQRQSRINQEATRQTPEHLTCIEGFWPITRGSDGVGRNYNPVYLLEDYIGAILSLTWYLMAYS